MNFHRRRKWPEVVSTGEYRYWLSWHEGGQCRTLSPLITVAERLNTPPKRHAFAEAQAGEATAILRLAYGGYWAVTDDYNRYQGDDATPLRGFLLLSIWRRG